MYTTPPITLALKYHCLRNYKIVQLLLDNQAKVNKTCSRGETVLHNAVHKGVPHDVLLQLISPENINMQTTFGYETALCMLHHSDSFRNWQYDCYEDRTSAISTTAHTLLDHGADGNIIDRGHGGPLRTYLANNKDLCLSLVDRLINQTAMLDEVYISIFSYFTNHHTSETPLTYKWLIQHLPQFSLQHMEVKCNHNRVAISFHLTEVESWEYRHFWLNISNIQVFEAVCMLLLETSTIICYISPTENTMLAHDQSQFSKQVQKKVDRLSETQCQPLSLVKLSIMSIRQHMPSKRDEDFKDTDKVRGWSRL
jgi:hypothetical protein